MAPLQVSIEGAVEHRLKEIVQAAAAGGLLMPFDRWVS